MRQIIKNSLLAIILTLSLGTLSVNSVFAETASEVKKETRTLIAPNQNASSNEDTENDSSSVKKETSKVNNQNINANSNEEEKNKQDGDNAVKSSKEESTILRQRIIKLLIVDIVIIIVLVFIKIYKTKKKNNV